MPELGGGVDWKLFVAAGGVYISLLWNLANTHRNVRVDRLSRRKEVATRFEAIYGFAVSSALKELSDCIREVTSCYQMARSVKDVAGRAAELRTRLTNVAHSFIVDLAPISKSSAALRPKEWEKLAMQDWDPAFEHYHNLKQAADLDACKVELRALEDFFKGVHQRLAGVRDEENNLNHNVEPPDYWWALYGAVAGGGLMVLWLFFQ